MSTVADCRGRSDAALLADSALLLQQRYSGSDAIGLERRRRELRIVFGCLSERVARPLHERLSSPDVSDPICIGFMRLAEATRQELLAELERVIRRTTARMVEVGPGSLPPSAGNRLLQKEIDSRLTEVLKLPINERLTTAGRTLRALRTLGSDPRFAEVDQRLVAEIERQAGVIEERLEQYARAREHNFKPIKRRDVSWGAVGLVAVLDGPQPGPADAVAVLLAGCLFLFATREVVVMLDPLLRRRQAVELNEHLTRVQDQLRQIPVRPISPAQTQPARAEPRTTDAAPPLTATRRRPRPACQRGFVLRTWGHAKTNYHNEFAAAMVAHFRIPASPDMDYRVTKGGLKRTDYDSYDFESNTYWEFKTRHDYLPYDNQPIKWLRLSSILAQATDQRLTLINCGLSGDLVWVFEDPVVATAAREYLVPWPVDSVLAQWWPGSKLPRRPRRPAP